jgi:two-component system NtrC family sensor kinase
MNGFNPYSVPPLLNLVCFSVLIVVTALRGARSRLNRLFLAICLFGILLNIDIVFALHTASAEAALAVSRADHFLLVFSLPVYIQFFHTYLRIEHRKWLEYAAWGFSAVLMAVSPSPWFIASMQRTGYGFFARAGLLYPFFGLAGLMVTVYVLVLLYRSAASETMPGRKNRLHYLLIGFGLMGFLNGLNVFPVMGWEMYPPGNLSFIPLVVFAFGLFRYDLLDLGFLLEKSVVHAAISAVLTVGFALVLLASEIVFSDRTSAVFPIVLFFIVAGFIGPLQARLRGAVDRRLFPRRYDFRRTLASVSRSIVAVLDADRIGRTIVDALKSALQVESCALFDRRHTGGPLLLVAAQTPEGHPMIRPEIPAVEMLGRKLGELPSPWMQSGMEGAGADTPAGRLAASMNAIGAEIALALPFSDREPGLLLLGKKCSGRMFTPEDIDLLETLAGQTSTALENARFYQELRSMNRALEQRVAEKTRDLKAALTEKERTLDQLIRSESLASLGQLVAGVAHELNNPLASVKSLLQSVAEDLVEDGAECDPEGDRVDDLQFADRELGRAQQIVASLLGLSRQGQTYTEAVDLNVVTRDALRVLYSQYKTLKIEIVEDLAPELPPIKGNFSNLGQVVLNLIQNAVQAMARAAGQIRLKTRHLPDARQVVFECIDTGPGIDADLQNDIFKPFFTTKPPGQGTGLGLYICHEIVRRHGGRILLCSGNGPGARFTVQLPVSSGNEQPGND